jgi:type I restriction enzyme, S subunit
MNSIDKLIVELCPNGVPFLPISKLCTTFSGGFIKKTKQDDEYEYPVYNGGAGPTGYYNEFNSPADSIAISGRGSIGFVNWVSTKFWAGNSCHVVKSNVSELSNKYLYYYLKHNEQNLIALKNTGSIPALNLGPLVSFLVAVPPKEIQNEIVNILDKFSELETGIEQELEAELEARKKQYSYYRFKLVDNNKSKTVKLKDITEATFWIMPSTPTYDEQEGVAYITSKNLSKGIIDYKGSKRISHKSFDEITKNRPIKEDDLLIGMIGTIGEIARVRKSDLPFYGQNMYLVRFNQELIDINYFLHYFDSELMKDYFNSIKNNSAQGYLKAEHIDNILIPLPSLSKQKEIARVLDIYSDLINNINIGIQAELIARRQQYEYYRDKLLTFKELESA